MQISNELSKEILNYLQIHHKMNLPDIAKAAGTTVAYVNQIGAGQKSFRHDHVDRIQFRLNEDIFLAMLPDLVTAVAKEMVDKGKKTVSKSKATLISVATSTKDSAFEILSKGQEVIIARISTPLARKLCHLLTRDKK